MRIKEDSIELIDYVDQQYPKEVKRLTIDKKTEKANILAALCAIPVNNLEGGINYNNRQVNGKQIVAWCIWNECKNSIMYSIKDEAVRDTWKPVFPSGSDNTEAYNEFENAQENVDKVKAFAQKYNCTGRIYFLRQFNIDDNWQELILLEGEYKEKEIDIPVTKQWNDGNNKYGVRPQSIEVGLYKGNASTPIDKATLSSSNNWKHTFEKVEPATYTVKETSVPDGYRKVTDGNKDNNYVIKNNLQVKYKIVKEWEDQDNRDGYRPSEITVKLYKNGKATNTTYKLSGNSNTWETTTGLLDKYDDSGNEIKYEFKEVSTGTNLNQYSIEGSCDDKLVDGIFTYKLENIHEPELVEIPVEKIWEDDTDRDGLRPSSIELKLWADKGTANERLVQTHILEGANNQKTWSYTFKTTSTTPEEEKTYKCRENGELIQYSVEEVEITNHKDYDPNQKYEAPTITPSSVKATKGANNKTTSKITITNKHVPETTNIVVVKEWDDDDNRDNMRKSVTFRLKGPNNEYAKYTNGKTVEEIKLSEENNWTYEVKDLFRYYNHGTEINYTLEEVAPDGYDFEVSAIERNDIGAIIKLTGTNKHLPELIEIPVEKIWDDDTDRDGLRPTQIELKLWADKGTQHEKLVQTAIVKGSNEAKTWSYTFTSSHENTSYDERIYKYRHNGILINYSIEEVEIPNHQEYDPNQRYEAPVITPESVKGTKGANNKTTPKITITNKHVPEITNIVVVKEWDDDDNRDAMRTKSVTFRLKGPNSEYAKYADGRTVESIVLSAENNWTYEINNLFRYYNHGTEINYTLEEVTVPGEYTFTGNTLERNNIGAIIKITGINKHLPELIEIPITKTWDDDTDRDGLRPDSIQLRLWADKGTQYEKLVQQVVIAGPDTENTWSYIFTSSHEKTPYDERIYKYRHEGILINYTIEEIKINKEQPYNSEQRYDDPQYITGKGTTASLTAGTITGSKTIRDTKTDGFEVINEHFPERMKLKIVKKWTDQDDLDEHRPESVTFTIFANGQKLTHDADGNAITNPVTITQPTKYSDTWVYEHEIENLFRYYDHGKEIDYTIVEGDVPQHYENLGMTKSPKNTKDPSVHVAVTEAAEKEIYTSKVLILTLTIENKQKPDPYYEGYKIIEGIVWVDGEAGKGNDINGKMDNGETRLEGVKVVLRAADGTYFHCGHKDGDSAHTKCKDTSVLTDKNGKYRIIVNRDINYDVYKLAYSPSELEERLNGAYVEFNYDGMKYTTVKYADSGADTSKAIEDESTRNTFDDKYDTVTPNMTLNSWGQHSMKATTQNVITNLSNYSNAQENNYDLTRQDNDYGKYTNVPIRYCYGSYYLHTCPVIQDNGEPGGAWLEPFKSTKYLSGSEHPDHKSCSGNHAMTTRTVDVNVITNVNLGLFEREQPSVGVFTELSKVDVQMNSQMYTYLYNSRTTVTDEKAQDAYNQAKEEAMKQGMSEHDAEQFARQIKVQAKFQNKDTYTYRRPVNPADITYVNQVNNNAMDVYVTYDVKLANSSTTLKMTYNSIVVYFDDDYTDEIQISRGTKGHTQTANGYKELNITGLNITVEPLSESVDVVSITYKVNHDTIKKLLNEEATLNHAVEITSYSTRYGEETLYAEQQTGGRTNKPYAGYDYESHPDNGGIMINGEGRLDFQNPEYDTDIAPSFVLCKDEEKSLSGNVWEDRKDESNQELKDFRVGNGKKDGNEDNLANAKVELFTVDENGILYPAKLYYTDGRVSDNYAVTFSDANGNYKFGNDECGVVTDRYVIKFTYGEAIDGSVDSTIKNVIVSGRNYKSTIISSETAVYGAFKGDGNEEWHLNLLQHKKANGSTYSIAVDDIEQRTKITHLQYSNFDDKICISAYSKPFKMQVEFDSENKFEEIKSVEEVSEGNYVVDGNAGHGRDLSVFDFGIIERAREDVFAQKTIEYIRITLANGQVLTEGDPRDPNQSPSYMLAAGFRQTISDGDAARKAKDKWLTIQMDPELMQGAQLDVKYAITVTNNSEKDYDYYHGDIYLADGTVANYDPSKAHTAFYYFGENQNGDKLIKSAVNYLVDYVDADFNFKWENAEHWTEASVVEKAGAIYLRAPGAELISEATAEALASGKYKAFITTEFKDKLEPGGGTWTEYAYATKKLSNTEDNDYENHMEILQLDAKMARTLKGKKNDGTPILKQYKMGNYVPSDEGRTISDSIELEQAGLHEQDDDRVLITITPPTGLLENIMKYGLISLGGLAILAMGVIIIKKKVLKK